MNRSLLRAAWARGLSNTGNGRGVSATILELVQPLADQQSFGTFAERRTLAAAARDIVQVLWLLHPSNSERVRGRRRWHRTTIGRKVGVNETLILVAQSVEGSG